MEPCGVRRVRAGQAGGGGGARRTPEKTLHLLSLAGGFPGALLAMKLVRHKRQKTIFVAVVWGVGALHVLAWVAVVWMRR